MPRTLNPILPGFHPDPSILRVGASDFYIATSTFEWYPGVCIYHSTSVSGPWRLVSRPLCRAELLDMRGVPDSCGVWAPCLSHDGERFWLVYTVVTRKDGSFKDTHNYIVTAARAEGPWGTGEQEPVYVNSSGFDPSLFHDRDTGRKWFVNMLQDHRRRPRFFAGIVMQEFVYPGGSSRHKDDNQTLKRDGGEKGPLIGPRHTIFRGTALDLVEGPHLYKRGGWYYLLTAEGGTAYGHACTLARSRRVTGPYDADVHPENPLLSSGGSPQAALQRAGHGDLVETGDGRWFLVHLMGRPVVPPPGPVGGSSSSSSVQNVKNNIPDNPERDGRCVLGRETSIQEVEWRDDGWCYVKGGSVPSLWVDLPGGSSGKGAEAEDKDGEDYWAEKRYLFPSSSPASSSSSSSYITTPGTSGLHRDFQWLRTPRPERIFRITTGSSEGRGGGGGQLRLIGREAVGSWFEQSLVARRQTHFSYDAETVLAGGYAPEDERQFAGLAAYYCRYNFFYLTVTGTSGVPGYKKYEQGQQRTEQEAGEEEGDHYYRELQILSSESSWPEGRLRTPVPEPVRLPRDHVGRVKMVVTVRAGREGQFWYALEEGGGGGGGEEGQGQGKGKWGELRKIGEAWDASILCDECGGHQAHGSFTGAFVGVACSDLNGMAMEAGFEEFVYRPVRHEGDRYEV